MNIKSYLNLISLTLIITFFSYFIELIYPCINDLLNTNIIGLFIFRYLHFISFIYFISFLYLFNYKSVDAIIYLILAVILTSTWKILDCCILSYYELKMYNVNHHDYLTNFHPCLFVFFREYQELALTFMGIIMAFTFYFILFKNEIIPLQYKLFLGIIFSYLFIDNIIQTRYYNKNLNYPKSKNTILNRYFTFI